MALFPYRCPTDGLFDLNLPVGTADRSTACPRCGSDAVRVYTPPRIAGGDRRRMAVIDHCERTRFAPDVVTSLPGGKLSPAMKPATGVATNPAWRGLPRP